MADFFTEAELEHVKRYGLCICWPPDQAEDEYQGCAENYEDDDPRRCLHCVMLDAEMPCPADPEADGYDAVGAALIDGKVCG